MLAIKNLLHIHPPERMLSIVQEYQQQNEGTVTIEILYDALMSINAKRAASLLLREAIEQRKRTQSESHINTGGRSLPFHPIHSMSHPSKMQMLSGDDFVDESHFSEDQSEHQHCDVTTVGVTNASMGDEVELFASTETPLNV